MTELDLDALEALASAATEGPWRKHDIGGSGAQEPESIVVHTGQFDWEALQDGETSVAWMPRWDSQEDADAEFIAAARELVPRLVAEVRARDTVIEAVRKLHQPGTVMPSRSVPPGQQCVGCTFEDDAMPTPWPCATIRALEGATDE